jgi:uncharacterized membrane protein
MWWLLVLACGDLETRDTADSASGADPACDDVVEVTYDSWGRGFLTTHCQGCHASTTADRYGAPEGVTFDNEDEVRTWADRIGIRVLDQADMPPAGGVPEDDLTLLAWWLSCGL